MAENTADAEAVTLDDSVGGATNVAEIEPSSAEEGARADELERRVQTEANAQFKRLKDEARAIFGLTRGRPGVRTAEEMASLLEEAGDEIGNGRFLVRCLGAERYLEPSVVAVLITLRQNLMAEISHATAADVMRIDAAVMGYYNVIRTQRWIGDLSLVVERELFGQEPLNEIHGPQVGERLEEQLRRLAEVLLPLQERAARMMLRGLDAIPSRSNARRGTSTKRRCGKRLAAPPVT